MRIQHMANRPALVAGEHNGIRWLWHSALSIQGGRAKLSLIAKGGKMVAQYTWIPRDDAATPQGVDGHGHDLM